MTTTTIIIIVLACVCGVASLLYGVFRKFSQMGWIPWQIPLIFLFVLLCDKLPETMNADTHFALASLIFLGGTGVILGIGGVLRYLMHAKLRPAHTAWRAIDRILGALTALMGYAVILLAAGGLALSLIENCIPSLGGSLSPVFESGVWGVVGKHALDFFVIAVLACLVQVGYRVGFGRGFIILLMFAFAVGTIVLTVFLLWRVPFFRAFGELFAGAFKKSDPIVANCAGFGIAGFILFAIVFTILTVLCFFLHKLVRRIRYIRGFGIVDGLLLAVILFAVAVLFLCALNVGVWWLAHDLESTSLAEQLTAEGADEILRTIADIARRVEAWITSSSFTRILYTANPFLKLL